LGGNEASTHEYISKLLGKSTIDTNTYGKSLGRNGNYSTNYQIAGRELLTPDEVRMLDNRYALLFIRGERPIQDEKFDILRHPNVAGTTDGKAAPYDHGEETRSIGTAGLVRYTPPTEPTPENPAGEQESAYALYSETDLENLFNEKENANYENTQKQAIPVTPPRKKAKPADGQRDERQVYPERRR
jgi:type IV secretion system protein VirD4